MISTWLGVTWCVLEAQACPLGITFAGIVDTFWKIKVCPLKTDDHSIQKMQILIGETKYVNVIKETTLQRRPVKQFLMYTCKTDGLLIFDSYYIYLCHSHHNGVIVCCLTHKRDI